MDKLKEILVFNDAAGNPITVFGGKFTLSQVVAVLICIIAVSFILKKLKGIIKAVLSVVIIAVAAIYFGIATPEQIKSIADKVAEVGVETYQKFAEVSENIKVEEGSIKICVGEQWVDVKDIASTVTDNEGKMSITVDGKDLIVDDEKVTELLNSLTE